jgi:hypothetical protein
MKKVKMNIRTLPSISHFFVFLMILFLFAVQGCTSKSQKSIILSCNEDNDLYLTLLDNKVACVRYNSPTDAIDSAGEGSGVLILANDWPEKTTVMDAFLFEKARNKKLRLYVEYPSYIPGMELGTPRGTHWERAVISSDAFAPSLKRHHILAINDCRFVPMEAVNTDIVIARVAGFDSAVYGLPKETFPVLSEIPQPEDKGGLLVATTKLSHFLTARYAPADAWRAIWDYVFTWLRPDGKIPVLKWTPRVRPSYTAEEILPSDIERLALKRGIDWYFNSQMLLHPDMMWQYNKPANFPISPEADPDLTQDWPYGHRSARMLKNVPVGDGTLGIMEGFDAKIFSDGSQAVHWWNRGDCNGEVAGTMGLAGMLLQDSTYMKTARNIGDWLFFRSMISLGDRADPENPAYGLFGWNDSPEYAGSGSMDGFAAYYGDDNARLMLGMMIAATSQKTDRYDERILRGLLGNLRVSGKDGFQLDRIEQGPLEQAGWKHFFTKKNTSSSRHTETSSSYSPHFQAYMWACYLWAYQQTGFNLFLNRAKTAIGMTMSAYPDSWIWTNGIQQERAKMLLPLAWLVRVEDTPEHRGWLRKIANDLLASQDKCGAIREELGKTGMGSFPPPSSNEDYGIYETPLIQKNGDSVCDLLYTVGFAFLGLHEAAAATGEQLYLDAEDKLAKFLCRIQIRSEKHPELDGGWFRAFDFNRWEYWASSGDKGWGAWCIETGWSQSSITAVLGLRQIKSSIWDFTKDSKIEKHFDRLQKQMLPDEVLASAN